MSAKQYVCGRCGDLGHNRRTCERRQADAVTPMFGDVRGVRAPRDAPVDVGPWNSCVAGDPWCGCVGGVGHMG